MSRFRFVPIASFAVVLTVMHAHAGTVYTTYVSQMLPGDESVLAMIDPVTGAVTEIGATGAERLGALTYDPVGGRLLGLGQNEFGDSSLYEISTTTGVATEIGALGPNITSGGLAFHTGTNTLFAVNIAGPSGEGTLLTIDGSSGVATSIGLPQPVGAWALAYHPSTSQLLFSFGFEEFGAPFGSFDPQTGAQSIISATGSTIIGMDYDPDVDVLYGISGAIAESGGLGNKLFTIDPLTGQATLLVTLDRSEFYSSLAVVPIPAPSGGAWLMAMGYAAARRRR